LKIGLIGAPGSGKTELAEALSNELNIGVIDEYVGAVEHRLNYVLGRYATYVGNLAVMMERFACEREVGDDYIVCGTPVDTVTYMAASSYFGGHEGWQMRSASSLAVAGCMVDDMWEYDHAFYLPGGSAVENEDNYLKGIEDELPSALKAFDIDFVELEPHKSLDQKVSIVKSYAQAKDSE
jgi:hypothetical protein